MYLEGYGQDHDRVIYAVDHRIPGITHLWYNYATKLFYIKLAGEPGEQVPHVFRREYLLTMMVTDPVFQQMSNDHHNLLLTFVRSIHDEEVS